MGPGQQRYTDRNDTEVLFSERDFYGMSDQARRLSNFTSENQASLISQQNNRLSEQIVQFKVSR